MNRSRIHRLVLAALLIGVAAPSLAAQDAPDRGAQAQPPPPLPQRPLPFPAFIERTLSNGARVIVVEDRRQPVVNLSLRIRAGAAADPAGRAGVAEFTAALLNKGTNTRSARDIAESIDFVGGTLTAGSGADFTSVDAMVLTEFLDTVLVLMSDVVLNPTFPEAELEIERQRTLSALQVELSQPGPLASRRFLREIYGDHPYGASVTAESVRAITRDDLVAFHQQHFRPGNALFVIAGDVRADDVVARLDRHFGGWMGEEVAEARHPSPPERTGREIVFVHKPGLVQATIRIGHLMPPAVDEDWTAIAVANQILGGGTTGWLFRILRGEKGYTYGAYAGVALRPGPGYFQAAADVRNEVVDSALTEFFRLLDALRDRPVPAEDLRTAKDYMIGSFPLSIETPQQIAGQIARNRLLGLPDERLTRYRELIGEVDAADVQRVAREHIRPDRAVVVIVGDATQILDRLEPFGSIRIFDTDGNPLRKEDLEVRGAEVAFNASAIEPRTLAYQLAFQGNVISEIATVITRERDGGREVVRSVSTGTGQIGTEEEIVVDGQTLEPIRSTSRQQMGPQTISAELRLEGGRILGTLSMPGSETKEVDAEAVPGTLLPGMDQLALQLIDFQSQKELRLPVFNAMTGGVLSITYKVVGETRITVPAGEFDVYEIEATGGPVPLTLYLRRDAPHLLVKQVAAGQPISLELKEIR